MNRRLFTPRSATLLFAATLSGLILGCHGVGPESDGTRELDRVEKYDPATDTWTEVPPTPDKMACPACAECSGRLYAFYGYSAFDYYPSSNTWTAAIAKDGKIFVTGGLLADGAWDAVFEYDPVGNAWVKKAGMPTSRYDHALGILGGEIYAVCGVGAPAH